jgi:truncated hemoglobin YjbI
MNLIDRIGKHLVEQAITEFYVRAFADPIIGHFFFHHDRLKLTEKQIEFASRILGGSGRYTGKPLGPVHQKLQIRPAHFGRRQVLMKQVALGVGIAPDLVDEWMRMEEALRPLIVS